MGVFTYCNHSLFLTLTMGFLNRPYPKHNQVFWFPNTNHALARDNLPLAQSFPNINYTIGAMNFRNTDTGCKITPLNTLQHFT